MEYQFEITYKELLAKISHRWGPRLCLNLRCDAYTIGPWNYTDISSRAYESGWTITGFNSYENGLYCNQFEAEHPFHGKIIGKFAPDRFNRTLEFVAMKAKTERAFQHFWEHHDLCIEGTKDIINWTTDSEDESGDDDE